MNFDDFLDQHQKLIQKPDAEKAERFIFAANICIDQMAAIQLELKNSAERWDSRIYRLIALRDQIQKQIPKGDSK